MGLWQQPQVVCTNKLWYLFFVQPIFQHRVCFSMFVEVDVNIKYRPGKNHADADGLSRLPAISSITEEQVKLPGMTWEHVDSHTIQAVCHFVETGIQLSKKERKSASPDTLLLQKEWQKLSICYGVLYRKCKVDTLDIYQLVLPSCMKEEVLQRLCDEMGHLGVDGTLDLAKLRFFWPHNARDVKRRITKCRRYIC